MFKKSFVFLVSALMIIGLFLTFPFPQSHAVAQIIQQQCGIHTMLANNTIFQQSLPSIPVVGDIIVVGATVTGTGNTAITSVVITDNNDAGTYSQIGRAPDQGNTLYVGWFNQTIHSVINEPFLINGKFTEDSGNAHSQNLQFCAYEVSLTPDLSFFGFGNSEGGSYPINTGSFANPGTLIMAATACNSSPLGSGSQITFNGTTDSTGAANNNFTLIGHVSNSKSGTFNGCAVTAFAEMAFIAFTPITITATSTVTGWLIPNFANNVNSYNWFYLIIVIFIPFGIIDIVLFMGGRLTAKIFTFFLLLGLALGATFGGMLTLTPVALIPIFWGVFIIFIWRFRG